MVGSWTGRGVTFRQIGNTIWTDCGSGAAEKVAQNWSDVAAKVTHTEGSDNAVVMPTLSVGRCICDFSAELS